MCFCDGTVSEYVFRWVKGCVCERGGGGGGRVSECACSCVFQREREKDTERAYYEYTHLCVQASPQMTVVHNRHRLYPSLPAGCCLVQLLNSLRNKTLSALDESQAS